jgi:endoglucanase
MRTRTTLGIALLLGTGACQADGTGLSIASETDQPATTVSPKQKCGQRDRTELFAPPPNDGALAQVRDLWKARDYANALKLLTLATTPHAAWFANGTPEEVRRSVQKTMLQAQIEHRLPVLVAYNVPYRDCAQYSSGGATDTSAYKAWITGFARGIGSSKAMVILEPDGLGIIPYNTTIYGAEDWCKPTVTDTAGNVVPAPGASPSERYAQLNYAVDTLAAFAPHAAVYLDGTHSAWLGVGEAAYRLNKAGVQRARGFFLNASNYQLTSENTQYGTWISMALAAPSGAPAWAFDDKGNFHFDWLPSQYDPAQNYALNYSPEYAATVTSGIQSLMGDSVATAAFAIDTSRNGQGPLKAAPYALSPYNQPASVVSGLSAGSWCNPYGAGAGLRPTVNPGVALLDAYLWIKVPGESDGSCDIAGGARAWDFGAYNPWGVSGDAQNHFDPLWGQTDPDAGKWFGAQAVQLAQNANPSLF